MPSDRPMPRNLVLLRHGENSRMGRKMRQKNPNEPIVPVEAPPPPEFLKGFAREKFIEYAALLAGMRVMTKADTDGLALVAQTFAGWKEAVEGIQKHGMIVKGEGGTPVRSPYIAIMNQCWDRALKGLQEFGLTPSARRDVAAIPKPVDDGE